ncbi:MAG: CRTAC1 family protein [Rhodothermales bacterium]|nr:CRTAC1 family protein [Rhodothermales bacterium]
MSRSGSLLLLLAASFLAAVPAAAQQFVERTSLLETRLSGITRPVSGGSVIDFNGDGLLDVYREGLLQRQKPDGTFENLGQRLGLDDLVGRTEGGVWADYNNDGFVDFLLIDRARSPRVFKNSGRWFFNRAERGLQLQDRPPITAAVWTDGNGDGWPDLSITGTSGTQGYLSRDGESFVQRHFDSRLRGCGLTATDHNGDGRSDLYVSVCDESSPADAFLRNTLVGSYQVDASVMSVTNGRLTRGAEVLDFDRDGDLDLLVANAAEEPIDPPRSAVDRILRNNGDGTFSTIIGSGIEGAATDQAWGLAVADFDNDGWPDVLVTNREAPDISASSYRLFRNRGDGSFEAATDSGLPVTGFSPRGVPLVGDLNGDGWIDVYMASEDGDRLFYNTGGVNHWIRVRLRGLAGDEDAPTNGLGAKIVVWSGGSGQAGQISGGGAHASQHHGLSAHFGLGANAQADSIVVQWANGTVDRFGPQPADREVILEEGGALGSPVSTFALRMPGHEDRIDLSDGDITFSWDAVSDPGGQPVTYDLSIAGPGVDSTITGIDGTSITVTPDFLRQQSSYFWTVAARTRFEIRSGTERRTFRFGGANAAAPAKLNMPLKALRSGQLAFADYDGDGDLDLALTGTDGIGGEARIYAAVDTLFPVGDVDQSFKVFRDTRSIIREVRDSHVSWTDYDGDGDLDLFLAGYFQDVDGQVSVVSEFYENTPIFQQDVQGSAGIPGVHQADGDWADFDGDGDDDLLLSGATSAGPPWSLMTDVLVNTGGTFSPLNSGMQGVRFARARWVDLDLDGDQDVSIMGLDADGAPVSRLYENSGGSFVEIPNALPTLYFGSMDWADYDGDGDDDLVMNGAVISPDLFSGRAYIYRNDNGVLTDIGADRDLAQVAFGDVKWVDYDLDGDLDVLLTGVGNPYGERVATVYRNEDNLRFAEEFRIAGVLFAALAVGDYNGDGDADLVLVGQGDDGDASVVFLLNLVNAESIPAALLTR